MSDGGIFVAEGYGFNSAVLAHSLREVVRSSKLHGIVDGQGDLLAVSNCTSHIVGVHCCGTNYGVGDLALCFSGRGGGYSGTFRGVQIGVGAPSIGYFAVGSLRAGRKLGAAAETEVGVAADSCHRDSRCVHCYHDTLGVGSRTGYIVGVNGCRSGNNISGILGGRNRDAVASSLVAPCVGDIAIGAVCNRRNTQCGATTFTDGGITSDVAESDCRCVHIHGEALGVGSRTGHIVGVNSSGSHYGVFGSCGRRYGDAVVVATNGCFAGCPCVGDSAIVGGGHHRQGGVAAGADGAAAGDVAERNRRSVHGNGHTLGGRGGAHYIVGVNGGGDHYAISGSGFRVNADACTIAVLDGLTSSTPYV